MTADVSGMFVNQCTVTDKHCIDGCVQCSANQNTLISHMLDSYVKPIDGGLMSAWRKISEVLSGAIRLCELYTIKCGVFYNVRLHSSTSGNHVQQISKFKNGVNDVRNLFN